MKTISKTLLVAAALALAVPAAGIPSYAASMSSGMSFLISTRCPTSSPARGSCGRTRRTLWSVTSVTMRSR